jgi:hypothetical protein
MLRQIPDDLRELHSVTLVAGHLSTIGTKHRNHGEQLKRLVLNAWMHAGIPKLLSSVAASFLFLSLLIVILSLLLIAVSHDFPHAAFSRRHCHACKRS